MYMIIWEITMYRNKVPATEVEFIAAVLVLRRSIFIFDEKDEEQQQSKRYLYQYWHSSLRRNDFKKSSLYFGMGTWVVSFHRRIIAAR